MKSLLNMVPRTAGQLPTILCSAQRAIHTLAPIDLSSKSHVNSESSWNKVNQVSMCTSTSSPQVQFQYRYYSASPGDVLAITADEFASLDKDSYQLIDVRQQHEWDEDYIEGAYLVPLDTILNNEFDVDKLRSKPCIVYCKAGIRSNMACTALQQFGVRAVNLKGGIDAVRDYEESH